VSQEGSPEALVIGNETLLGRMVENLIDNAVRHNEPDGWIHVRTEVDTDMARLSVENGGPVLDDEALAALVQPFRRLAADRTSSDNGLGLGLSIVSSIVETHGGCVELHAIPDGGFRAVVELPLARLAELATAP
jgi:signal transduction histidine kinase